MKVILLALSLTSFFICNMALATDKMPKSPITISLYNRPQIHASVVEKVLPQTPLIAIYRQGDWLKVGDSNNGLVGWLFVPLKKTNE